MSQIRFGELCEILNKIQNEHYSEKPNVFRTFMLKCCSDNLTEFYPILRLFLPEYDKERGAYGLKERKLGEIIAHILNLPKTTSDYKALLNYSTSLQNNLSDFTDVACSVLRKRFLKSANLSVGDVNKYLDNIAKYHNSIREKEQELKELFDKTNNAEQKWILRFLLKDLKLGIGKERILNLYHRDAVKVFYYKSNLAKTCELLHSYDVRMDEIEIELFSPFFPMLSEKCDIKIINTVVNDCDEFLLEEKFDGERFQIHMNDGVFKYFSRNGYDYTNTFGENYDVGLLSPHLRTVFNSSVRSIVLDGEMMGFNKDTQSFGSKGMHFDVKNLSESSIHQPCFIAFDILLLNGKILTNDPLLFRLENLKKMITPKRGNFMVSEVKKFRTKNELLNYFNKTLDDEEEGVVFKKPDSKYRPNSRKQGWWKLKLEYFENVMSDLDVIIMGGYYGEGANSKKVTGFLVGVADKYDEHSLPKSYLAFCKIQSGLSNAEIEWIHNKIGQFWKNSGNPETHGLIFGKELPHLWIPPENSLILVVRGSELTRVAGNDYKTPYTIRFPRIQRINKDKPYFDCLTTLGLSDMTRSRKSVIKLTRRHLTLDDLQYTKRTKRRQNAIVPIEYKDVEKTTNILEGYEFCVWSGIGDYSKTDVEKLVASNGGEITQVERKETYCVLMSHYNSRYETRKAFLKDVVNLTWILRILEEGDFQIYNKNEVLYATPDTKMRLMVEYDKFGDSFIKPATEKSLKEIVSLIKEDSIVPSAIEIADLREEMRLIE